MSLSLLCYAVKSGVTCEACELVVGYVYKLVDSKTEVHLAVICNLISYEKFIFSRDHRPGTKKYLSTFDLKMLTNSSVRKLVSFYD